MLSVIWVNGLEPPGGAWHDQARVLEGIQTSSAGLDFSLLLLVGEIFNFRKLDRLVNLTILELEVGQSIND